MRRTLWLAGKLAPLSKHERAVFLWGHDAALAGRTSDRALVMGMDCRSVEHFDAGAKAALTADPVTDVEPT